MSDYQLNFLDRRIQYLEGKIQNWEKVIDQLMKNESFMHALEVAEMKKNRTVNTDSSYIVKANYSEQRRMITYIDIALAIVYAWFILNAFFVPFIGPILSYGIYEFWIKYCNYRKMYK